MKKIFITSKSMIIGGIEKSLIAVLNTIDYSKYEVTLLLEERVGPLLNDIPSSVKVIEYKPKVNGNILIRKIKNRLKLISFILKHKNRYDVVINFTPYTLVSYKIIEHISKNTYVWTQTDYTKIYTKEELDNFLNKRNFKKIKNLVFVSNASMKNFEVMYPRKEKNYLVCRNFMPANNIIKKSKESINYKKDNCFTFLNVSRHEEDSKKISRIIEASLKLKQENLKFKVLLIGNGVDTLYYKDLVKKYNLEEYVIFLGEISNPLPYYLITDSFIITSDYEGGPITMFEAFILNLPVITTDVGDALIYFKQNGILIEKNVDSLIKAMKKMITENKKYRIEFDAISYNNEIKNTLESIISGDA